MIRSNVAPDVPATETTLRSGRPPSRVASPTDSAPSTSSLVVELSQLEYAMRARVSRDAWGSTAAADRSFASLLQRRKTILAVLRRRGVDFAGDVPAQSQTRSRQRHVAEPCPEALGPPPEPTHAGHPPTAHLTSVRAVRQRPGHATADLTERRAVSPDPAADPAAESAGDLTGDLVTKVEQLERGLVTRTVIGQAQGILMERHKITADEAFRILRTASSVTNRKLRDIADDLVATGQLPGPPTPHR